MSKAGIIGSGVAGLATAARLSSKGYDVTVFESNDYPGGKVTQIEQDGYRFDAGPSLFTAPQLLDDVFTDAGKNPRNYFNFRKVDPGCHYYWKDGTEFKAFSETEKFARDAANKFHVNEQDVKDYIAACEKAYDITEDVFLKHSLHKTSTYLRLSTLKSFFQLHKAHVFSTLNSVNSSMLKHPKLVQLFNRYATYNGSNPYRAPGTLMVIPTLEYRWGTFLPVGGMHAITESLFELCQDLGVNFRFGEQVEEIKLENNKVTGLHTASGNFDFDLVVSNMDIVPTYNNLLKNVDLPKRIAQQERSSSALIFYWGIKKEFDELGLHNIFWSDNYREEFDYLFNKKEIHSDPTIYINITSKHEKKDAPKGCENWFVMVNAPCNTEQNWDKMISQTRRRVLSKLSSMLNTNVEDLIETENMLTPLDIENKTSSYLGSLYGTSSNSMMAAFFRHPNFHRNFKNLFFCGGSVHPGGGIPLCLLSGKITSELINEQSSPDRRVPT